MIKARWQGFEVASGENPVSLAVHWSVLKQALIFSLFSIPLLSVVGHWLAKWLLKPHEQAEVVEGETSMVAEDLDRSHPSTGSG